jgi:hypothetical protein
VQQDQLELLVEQDQLVQQVEHPDQDLKDLKDQVELKDQLELLVFQLHVHPRSMVAVVAMTAIFKKMQNTELTWQ